MAAAKEFNIGTNTLIEFLVSKSFSADDLKPTTKLTDAMYRVLQSEFQQDKAAKQKAEKVDLPKGAGSGDQKKKRDEEDLSIKKKEEKIKAAAAAEPEEVKVEVPVVEEKIPEPVQEIVVPETTEKKSTEDKSPAISNIEAPEIGGLKVLDKIDLDSILMVYRFR